MAKFWAIKALTVRYFRSNGDLVPPDKEKLQQVIDDGWEPFSVVNARPTVLQSRVREIWFRKEV